MAMMKKTAAVLALLAAGLVFPGSAVAADKAALGKKQDALAAEYALAKESSFYFVLDVLGRKLELRVRGMVLRSWPLQAMRFWGRPDFAGTVELVRKTTLKTPERIVIKPGEDESLVKAPEPAAQPPAAAGGTTGAADYDLEALELRDMPKRFSLDFDNGLHVTISAEKAGSGGFFKSMGDAWRWYIGLPLSSLFSKKQGRGGAELMLTFESQKDAQAIYWHFFDGIKGIIL